MRKSVRNIYVTFVLGLTMPIIAFSISEPKSGATGKLGKSAASAIPEHYSKIVFSEFSYQPPYPLDYRVKLDRGVVAYLVPDSTLPLIQMTILFGNPNLPAKPSEAGAINLYSSLLKAGGTVKFSPEQLEDSLEFVAASISAGLSDYQSDLGLDALRKDAGALFELLPEVALSPRLDGEAFKVQKKTLIENLHHRYDTPHGVMNIAYEHVMFGSHPANWLPTEKEVSALTPAKLKSLRGKGFSIQNMVIGVAGQFDRTEMIKQLNKLVAKFPDSTVNIKGSISPFKGAVKSGVYLIDKQVTQATIKLGAPGVKRPDPDYYPLVVASYIFGDGGFTSRLVERVRSNEGLVYGIDSDVGSDYYRKSSVSVSLQTKVETAAYAVKLVLEEMRKLVKDGITDQELQRAKDGLIKSLPSMFETPAATARIFAQGEIWKRSPEHYKEYIETINRLTKSDVQKAFQKYFVADSMRIVVVGPKESLLKKDERGLLLSDFGPLNTLSLDEIEARK